VHLDPQLVTAIGATCCVGWMMTTAGMLKNGLEWRRRKSCPSCGRDVRACRCT